MPAKKPVAKKPAVKKPAAKAVTAKSVTKPVAKKTVTKKAAPAKKNAPAKKLSLRSRILKKMNGKISKKALIITGVSVLVLGVGVFGYSMLQNNGADASGGRSLNVGRLLIDTYPTKPATAVFGNVFMCRVQVTSTTSNVRMSITPDTVANPKSANFYIRILGQGNSVWATSTISPPVKGKNVTVTSGAKANNATFLPVGYVTGGASSGKAAGSWRAVSSLPRC